MSLLGEEVVFLEMGASTKHLGTDILLRQLRPAELALC